jgi:iron complex outermembrane receptor protein
MFTKTRTALLLGAFFSISSYAQTIQGVVTDSDGNVLTDATVEIMGTNLSVNTNAIGEFVFKSVNLEKVELHVSALGFAHLNQNVMTLNEGTAPLSIALRRSAIEVIDVTATPFHSSIMGSAAPVTVLSGETLRRQQASTLGDTLEKQVGVHTNFHANVASTPIIRGLSGARVLIAQNGLDVSDVSRVGPDHSVATEVSTVRQIEVLRGPATLFFGSGAIGGVVNVVDERVPTNSDSGGEWLFEADSVNNQKIGSFNIKTGNDKFAFYADGFFRDADDYAVPVNPESEDKHGDEHEHDHAHDDEHEETRDNFTVENSAEESSGFTLGTSYLLDNGYVGVSVGKLDREYGIPGHSHEGSEGNIYADLTQDRYQLISELAFDNQWINAVNIKAGYTDYQHAEIESGLVGTTFKNQSTEVRSDILHQPVAGWRGGVSLHYKKSEVEAQGAEAFTPPSTNTMFAFSVMEERHFDKFLIQLGARVERVQLTADAVLLPMFDAHSDSDSDSEDHQDEHSHDNGHGHEDDYGGMDITRVFNTEQEFTPVTLSAGLVWDFAEDYNVGISISRSERAPSASELLSFGPHIGTGTYEVGALFALDLTHGEPRIGLTNDVIDLETSNNIDITYRKTQGAVGFVFNAFYNQIDNYYNQIDTGLFAEGGHEGHDHGSDEHEGHDHGAHGSNESGGDDHSDELPVLLFQADDVILYGFEAQVAWQVTPEFKASVLSDFVRAKLQNGGDLPRTPPMRFGTELNYIFNDLSVNLDVMRYERQDRIAEFETETDGYTLVNATVSYQLPVANQDIVLYLQGTNLTDTEARVHTSFLKDIAPRPGRSLAVGLRGYF